jgi:hypothetical protein
MSKFILVDIKSYVSHVEDTAIDSNNWIEVSNDSVAQGWYYQSDGTVVEQKPITIEEMRELRNKELQQTDWMVMEDSPYQAAGQETNLANIKTYRQALRDLPDESVSYTEKNIQWPALTIE